MVNTLEIVVFKETKLNPKGSKSLEDFRFSPSLFLAYKRQVEDSGLVNYDSLVNDANSTMNLVIKISKAVHDLKDYDEVLTYNNPNIAIEINHGIENLNFDATSISNISKGNGSIYRPLNPEEIYEVSASLYDLLNK